MNFLFISPNFPKIYSHFVKALREIGFNVLGIGDEPFDCLNNELKDNINEYCYVSDLKRFDWMKNTIDYLQNKYGHIDYIESNNEFWLENDAKLREYAHSEGLLPEDMEKIKYKSKMKIYFEQANVKTARFQIVSTIEKAKDFIKLVGYPVFAKPDNGVGAAHTYKIKNDFDLNNFFSTKPNEIYIMEEFIDGYIVSFDGICDSNSNVIASVAETFPIPIAEVVEEDRELYYYANKNMPQSFKEMGQRTVKSFGITKRCFHIEFFVLKADKPGLGFKNDILGLEVNMRCPGGNTPDLISLAWSADFYKIYASVMKNNISTEFIDLSENSVSISVSRKYRFEYLHSEEEIIDKYTNEIKMIGDYPESLSGAMGKHYYFAVFKTLNDALLFKDFIQKTL